jgi:hypothetical protein
MQIFHNAETRQMIVTIENQAFSVFLQADETPKKKAGLLLAAHDANPANISTCEEIDLTIGEPQLPVEDGPKEPTDDEILKPTNGDGKTN